MRLAVFCMVGTEISSWRGTRPQKLPACFTRATRCSAAVPARLAPIKAASREVTAPAAEQVSPDSAQSVEMFVANSALQHFLVADRSSSPSDSSHTHRRVVPSPRVSSAVAPPTPGPSSVDIVPPSGSSLNPSRALKVELGLTAAELQSKGAKLAQAQLALRQRDSEIVELKDKLNEKDLHIQRYKAEIRESRVKLQEKDVELRMAYQQLMDAATERAQLRELLILTEQELQQTKAELKNWTDGLFEVKSLIDSIDDDGVLPAFDLNGVASLEPAVAFADSAALTEEELDKALDFLKNLSEMSRTLLEDAKNDEAVFETPSPSP